MNRMMRREGYWYNAHEGKLLPMPSDSTIEWEGKKEFLDALHKREQEADKAHYRGFSMCRICDVPNGSISFQSEGWEWPSGFSHYIEEHNVRPSLAFQEFILGRFLTEGQ